MSYKVITLCCVSNLPAPTCNLWKQEASNGNTQLKHKYLFFKKNNKNYSKALFHNKYR